MFMQGPDSIKKPSINLSTQIAAAGAANAANKISEDGVSAVGGVNPKVSEGASVAGNGKSPAAGKALLEMMSNPDGVVPVSGFSNGKTERKPIENGATIETHAKAFLANGPEAQAKFVELMERADRGAEPSSGKFSQREIELGRQAVIPLDGPDAQFKELLKYAFSLAADRHAPVTKETIINSFLRAKE
jgi:hypothetical protein